MGHCIIATKGFPFSLPTCKFFTLGYVRQADLVDHVGRISAEDSKSFLLVAAVFLACVGVGCRVDDLRCMLKTFSGLSNGMSLATAASYALCIWIINKRNRIGWASERYCTPRALGWPGDLPSVGP